MRLSLPILTSADSVIIFIKNRHFFENSKRYFVDKRLLQRIELTEHQSFRGYFTYLRFQASGEELQAVINALTVNETYFFREISQLESLVEEVLMTSYAIGQVS